MNFDDYRDQIKARGVASKKYESAYAGMISRVESTIVAKPGGNWGDPRRIRKYSLVLRQTLLHRAIKLFEGSIQALINDNSYAIALLVRGHFETTAAIGYLHNRLNSMKMGNLSPAVVDKDVGQQILGTRDETILESSGEKRDIAEAKQVLTMLEYADKSVSKHILGKNANKHFMLKDSYKWLCEFAHPNFHSNTLAYSFDKASKSFTFSCDKKITKQEISMIELLLMSSLIFEDLYDRIAILLPAE